jgi:hypothetical protein
MAKRKPKAGRFICKVCGFVGTGPNSLHLHYKGSPSHQPKALRDRKANSNGAKPVRKYTFKKKRSAILPTAAVKFCPHCGSNIQVIQVALEAAETMKGNNHVE